MKSLKIEFLFLSAAALLLGFGACTFDKNEEQVDCSILEGLELVDVQSTTCGNAAGSIEVFALLADGFQEEVTYRIIGFGESSTPVFENLSAGNYEVEASISNECSQTISVLVENEDGLNISVNASPSDCGSANGQIQITTEGVTGNVAFSLNGNAQSQGVFQNLAPGKYTIEVEDDANCLISQEVKILSKTDIGDIQAIVNTNCALSGCHGGNVSPNLSSQQNIEDFAERIRTRTGNKTMPPPSSGGSLSDAQIDAIACWVEDKN